ncbi:probable cytochrome P450 12b2, mitochondrial [Leptidea sinapis]|uniref:probable cytochrome P450 12b2, mitochondrial n=1 Tax=Leptidea sinapis TaxID=189913 RepID=UPI00212BC35F|nr:probable cytochrome P450 12b2, mitochondrial [Leptidea sinapis]
MKLLQNTLFKRNPFMRSIVASKAYYGSSDVRSWKDIPGPTSVPVLGQLYHFLPGGSLYELMGYPLQKELYNRYGNIVRVDSMLGRPSMVHLYDAEAAAQILRGENSIPIRHPVRSVEYYRRVYRKEKNMKIHKFSGLFNDQGEVWKEFRSATDPILMHPKSVQSFQPIVDDVAQDMIKRLRHFRDDNNMIRKKITNEINLWSMESIAAIALGDRINCLDPNLPEDSPVNKLIENIAGFFEVSYLLDFQLNLWPYNQKKVLKRAMQIYENIDELCQYFINKAMLKLQRNELRYSSALEKLIEYDETTALIMVADMLFGGADTSSNALLFILYLLAKNPDKQQKLRVEVISNSGSKVYMRACIKEAMRILPAAPENSRVTTREYDVLGYRIPKDMTIMLGHQLMCTMENYYPKANQYIPERWIVNKDNPLYQDRANSFAYSPFGFGVRMCIGRRIVEAEIEALLTRLMENFHIGWDGPSPNIKHTFVNAMVEPLYFTFKDV